MTVTTTNITIGRDLSLLGDAFKQKVVAGAGGDVEVVYDTTHGASSKFYVDSRQVVVGNYTAPRDRLFYLVFELFNAMYREIYSNVYKITDIESRISAMEETEFMVFRKTTQKIRDLGKFVGRLFYKDFKRYYAYQQLSGHSQKYVLEGEEFKGTLPHKLSDKMRQDLLEVVNLHLYVENGYRTHRTSLSGQLSEHWANQAPIEFWETLYCFIPEKEVISLLPERALDSILEG